MHPFPWMSQKKEFHKLRKLFHQKHQGDFVRKHPRLVESGKKIMPYCTSLKCESIPYNQSALPRNLISVSAAACDPSLHRLLRPVSPPLDLFKNWTVANRMDPDYAVSDLGLHCSHGSNLFAQVSLSQYLGLSRQISGRSVSFTVIMMHYLPVTK